MSSPVRFTVDRHLARRERKMEDTAGERKFRRILESLQLQATSQVEGDFTVGDFVFEVDGAWKEGDQSLLDKRAWKRQQLHETNFLVIPFKDQWILKFPELVATIVQAYVKMAWEAAKT
jgi:hypothetical protein